MDYNSAEEEGMCRRIFFESLHDPGEEALYGVVRTNKSFVVTRVLPVFPPQPQALKTLTAMDLGSYGNRK